MAIKKEKKRKRKALVCRIQMVQAAMSVVLVKSCPAENTLDPVDIKGSSTCRTEKRFGIRLQLMANVYVILVTSDTFMADMDFKVRINQE